MWKFPSFLVNAIKLRCMFHGLVIFQGCFLRLRYQQQVHDVEDVVVDVWNLSGLWALMRSNHPNSAASQPRFHWRVARFKETSSSATDVDARPRMLWWCFEILFGEVFTVSVFLEAYIFVKFCEHLEVEASKSKSGDLMDARSRDWWCKLWDTKYFNIYGSNR